MTEPARQPKQTIRQLREERGWSQADLGRHLGLSRGSVVDWEYGLSHPRGQMLFRLAHLFGVDADDIVPSRPGQARQDGPRAAPMTEPVSQPTQTIRQLRQERAWSQRELARRLRVPPSTVFRWEHRGQVPMRAHQQRLAALFGVSIDAMAFGEGEEP